MLQAALEIDGEWMSYLLRPGRTYLHHKATTSFWHLEGIVREKAKDWTNRDADESLTPRQASAGEVAWTMAPYHFLTPTKKPVICPRGCFQLGYTWWECRLEPWPGWQAPCLHAAQRHVHHTGHSSPSTAGQSRMRCCCSPAQILSYDEPLFRVAGAKNCHEQTPWISST